MLTNWLELKGFPTLSGYRSLVNGVLTYASCRETPAAGLYSKSFRRYLCLFQGYKQILSYGK